MSQPLSNGHEYYSCTIHRVWGMAAITHCKDSEICTLRVPVQFRDGRFHFTQMASLHSLLESSFLLSMWIYSLLKSGHWTVAVNREQCPGVMRQLFCAVPFSQREKQLIPSIPLSQGVSSSEFYCRSLSKFASPTRIEPATFSFPSERVN